MAIIRWEPAREISSLQSEMNRVFNTFFDAPSNGTSQPGRWVPAMDLVEGDDHFVLTADLPGLDENDVAIEVVDDVLTISGERRTRSESSSEGYVRVERGFGAFRRTLTLPEDVDAEGVTASFDKGVLEVRIPKPEERKPRRVEIKVGDARPSVAGADAS